MFLGNCEDLLPTVTVATAGNAIASGTAAVGFGAQQSASAPSSRRRLMLISCCLSIICPFCIHLSILIRLDLSVHKFILA